MQRSPSKMLILLRAELGPDSILSNDKFSK